MIYTVEIVPGLSKYEGLYGDVTYDTQVIRIAGDINPARQFNIFLHELTHAILYESSGRSDHDEGWVYTFSNYLTQVALDNGWMVGGASAMES